MNRRQLIHAAAAIATLLALTACGDKAAPPAPKKADAPKAPEVQVVKIGVASPLTGAQAHIGIDIRNGVQLAIEDANKAGVSIGGKAVKLEMVAEDDEANPTKATTVAQKLADAKVSAVVGHFNSGASIPASKIYADAGIPQISPSSTNPDYTLKGYKTTFRVVADDVHLGGTLGRYAVNNLKGKSIAVTDDRTAYGKGVAEEFRKAVEAGDKAAAEAVFKASTAVIDRIADKKIIHKNKAARHKSRLAKQAKALTGRT